MCLERHFKNLQGLCTSCENVDDVFLLLWPVLTVLLLFLLIVLYWKKRKTIWLRSGELELWS